MAGIGISSGQGYGAPVRPIYQPLPAPRAATLKQSLLDHTSSGLQYMLGTLDKPGRAVRGLLGGHPDELKSAIPFSDTLGITDPARAVSGRDLTDQIGLTKRGDKGWGAWAAGIGTEFLTDPLSYATLGAKAALTPAGRALKSVGATRGISRRQLLQGVHGLEPELLAAGHNVEHLRNQGKWIPGQDAINAATAAGTKIVPGQPVSALAGIGVPFRSPSVFLGQGPRAQAVAGAFDKIGRGLTTGNALGRAIGSNFNPKVGGAVGQLTQEAYQKIQPQQDALQAANRLNQHEVIQHLDPLIRAGMHTPGDIVAAARTGAEGVAFNHVDPALAAQITPAAQRIAQIGPGQLAESRGLGIKQQALADPYADYVPRQAILANPKALDLKSRGQFNTFSGAQIHREEVLRNVPGGSSQIDRWAMDPRVSGASRTLSDPDAASHILNDMVTNHTAQFGSPPPPLGMVGMAQKAEEVAGYLKNLDDSHAHIPGEATPLFNPNIVGVLGNRGDKHTRTVTSALAALEAMAAGAKRPSTLGGAGVPMSRAIRALGLTTFRADKKAGTPMYGAMVELAKRLARHGMPDPSGMLMGSLKRMRKNVDQFALSPEHYNEIIKAHGQWSTPETTKSMLGALDSVTGMFKNLAYPLWPASHVRNAASAFVTNTLNGTPLSAYGKQYQLMTGRGNRDLSKMLALAPAHLSDPDKLNWIRAQQFAHGKVYQGAGMVGDLPGARLPTDRLIPDLPGFERGGPTGNLLGDMAHLVGKEGITDTAVGAAQAFKNHPFNPLAALGQGFEQQGVFGGAKNFPGLEAGRKASSAIEDFFRGANMIGNMEKGMSPSAAGSEVRRLHFDYDKLTAFEKNVMRRVIPFYTFASRNLPLQLGQTLATPAKTMAQLRPLAGVTKGSYTPEYLASGAAIPLGQEENGQQRYLSQLGTPLEEAFERMHFKDGLPDVRATALHYLASLNPVIKGPMEQLFNTQFHTQRPLSDLRAPGLASSLGHQFGEDNPQLLSQMLVNTPFTRFITAADKLVDSRKGFLPKLANLATGLRVTDVDMDKTRAMETRKALEDVMSREPNLSKHVNFYVKPGDKAKLSPREVELMRMFSQMQQEAQRYAKQQRPAVTPKQ